MPDRGQVLLSLRQLHFQTQQVGLEHLPGVESGTGGGNGAS
jgi:hypothetical protein